MASSCMESSSSLMPSSSVASSSKTVTLKSSDEQFFNVGVDVAMMSVTIKRVIEDGYADTVIPIINTDGRIVAKVLDYCKTHMEGSDKTEIDSFDSLFLQVDRYTLLDLLTTANYLEIKTLMELICQKVADTIQNMTVEQVREYFNITGDFTPEEEEKLRNQNAWAFEL